MKSNASRGAVIAAAAVAVFLASAQGGKNPTWPPPSPPPHVAAPVPAAQDESGRLPNGKSQREEILKAEHEQNLKDAARLADLAQELKEELEKNDRYVVSMTSLKKMDEIEKLVKRIRSRLHRN